jgi:class 3 adenylate cyclase
MHKMQPCTRCSPSATLLLLPPPPAQVFRGLRLKVGLDMGRVSMSVHPAIGRMTYRGRPMNKAARVCGEARRGQVWATQDAWNAGMAEVAAGLGEAGISFTAASSLVQTRADQSVLHIAATPMGAHKLKGVQGEVQLVGARSWVLVPRALCVTFWCPILPGCA